MNIINGSGVSSGIAFGKLYYYSRDDVKVRRSHVDDVNAETKRFESAKSKAIDELQNLYDKALGEVGETGAMIFEIHKMMLEDLDYCEAIMGVIQGEQVNAEYAVAQTSDKFSKMFSSMDDSYMKERAADVKDVSEKLIKILSGAEEGTINSDEPVIIVTDDLLPSETVRMDKSKILGFITERGSSNSHTAILARTMSIPAVVGVSDILNKDLNGKAAAIDGFDGKIFVEPDEETASALRGRERELIERKAHLKTLKGKKSATIDGQKVNVYANVGQVSDIDIAYENDAEGIGLFRSEFLYLGVTDYPTEEYQFNAYKAAAEKSGGKTVVIRTLDIGADKQVDYFDLPKEDNPAMGFRAIRICLERKEIFKTQLRAIYRASAYGKLAIMFPMIISVEEVLKIKKIIAEVKDELSKQGIAYSDNVETGIMIETPAAAIISDELAREVDFFSIGTNDLTQYTLAVDRQNQKLESFYNPHHKAVLRLIKMVADNAHKAGIWAGICGELAGDLSLTKAFLAMGIDELSVSPSKVLTLRDEIRKTNVNEVRSRILKEIEE